MTTTEMPDVIRRAIEAQGRVDPDAVLAEAEAPPEPADPEPVDAAVPVDSACARCGERIKHDDRNVLKEVIGWSRHRQQGGQNHVIGRVETGRLMCGECASRIRIGLDDAQEKLDV